LYMPGISGNKGIRLKVEVKDSRERVTGSLKYVNDLPDRGMLHGKFFRLPVSRARLISVDREEALKVPGVFRIFTAADFTGEVPRYGPMVMDQPILAVDEVRYFGEPVAIVLAGSAQAAEAGVARLTARYEELTPVLRPGAGPEEAGGLVADQSHLYDQALKGTNINSRFTYAWGDCDAARKGSDLVLENTYTSPPIHHHAMETYTCIAEPESDGVAVTTAIQSPFQTRRILSAMLGLPQSKVKIRSLPLGGGFGGRGYPKAEPAAAWFAHTLGRPVKISLSGKEGFLVGQRESASIRVITGFDRTGLLTFQEMFADFGVGAYSDISPRVINKSGMLGSGPYRIPHNRVVFTGYYTNTTPSTAFRGFGAPHINFAIEAQMEEAAGRLGISGLEIRLKNLPDKGEVFIPNEKPADGDWKACLLQGAEKIGLGTPAPAGRVRVIAAGIKNSIAATTYFARVRLHSDGSAAVYAGTSEMGQGSRSVMAKLVNEYLGVPLEAVEAVNADTERVPFDFVTASSRSTVSMGIAIRDACGQIRQELFRLAEKHFGRIPLEIREDRVVLEGGEEYPYQEILSAEYGPFMGEIERVGSFVAEKDSRNPLGGHCTFYEFVVTALEMSVDQDTGEISVHRMVNVVDAGRIINPRRAAGVDEGGAVMGLGAAVMEHLTYGPDGRLLNGSTLDYRIPTFLDIPEEMESWFIENRDGPGPGGEKGIGEGAILAVAPAIREGIYLCTGVNIRDLPFTPETVWKHLKERQNIY